MSVRPLPGDVAAQIKSAVVITSLNGVISGLLKNSLDAGASKINISVSYSYGNCSVEDNGPGIPPADFREDGGLGRLHYTSKYPPRAGSHGRYGTFLASLATLSLLTVASHHYKHQSQNAITIHNSKVVARNFPALPEERVLSFPTGTRVMVRDLFGCMPVRVKQRAVEADSSGSAKSFDQLVLVVVALLLAWPDEVAVSVRDGRTGKTVSLRTSDVSTRAGTHDILARSARIFMQAGLTDNEKLDDWVPIKASVPGVSLNGCICRSPVATKRVQFIALGIQPLVNQQNSNFLYEAFNKVFANSDFGMVDEADMDDGRARKTEGFTGRELKPRKGLDRWPMFFLKITWDGSMDVVDPDGFLDEGRHSVAVITDLLQETAYQFLKKNLYRPKLVKTFPQLKSPATNAYTPPTSPSVDPYSGSSDTHSTRDTKKRRASRGIELRGSKRSPSLRASESRSTSPFKSWPKVKLGNPTDTVSKDAASSSRSPLNPRETAGAPEAEEYGADADEIQEIKNIMLELAAASTDKVQAVEVPEASQSSETTPTEVSPPLSEESTGDAIVWIDPVTRIRSLIDPRTRFAIRSSSTAPEGVTRQKHKAPEAGARDGGKSQPRQPNHELRELLLGAKAHVFEPLTETPIPRLPENPELDRHACQEHGDLSFGVSGRDSPNCLQGQGRISKDALRKAEIIGQADQKFILAKVPTETSDMMAKVTGQRYSLVLIDQHAADERCRVEALMKTYFVSDDSDSGALIAHSDMPARPLQFDVSRQEGNLLARFRGYFQHWGIFYDTAHHEAGVKVEVYKLPPSILERCRLEPRLLIELLRKEVWKLDERPGTPVIGTLRRTNQGGEHDWIANFHDCPKGILDMINNRACRSAIMFNDPLSVEECVDLVRRLTGTAFPFQCAHGRPSMVPLVSLGSRGTGIGGQSFMEHGEEKDGNLLGDLKRWTKARKSQK